MARPMGESKRDGLRVDFDRRLKLEFHGSQITSDGGLLAYRELDDALGLTEVAGTIFQDSRTGKNGWHGMTGQFRQSVFGLLGGYEDVNDADRGEHRHQRRKEQHRLDGALLERAGPALCESCARGSKGHRRGSAWGERRH